MVNPKNAIDILNSNNNSLVRMSIEHGEMKVKALLTVLISDTLDFFSIGKTMSDTQVAQTIDIILEDFSVYKPDYFILCFKRAKKGNYGIVYDRIDGQVILEWLSKFNTEYVTEIENNRIKEKRLTELDTNSISQSEIESLPLEQRPVPMPEYFKEFLEKQKTKKAENLIPKAPLRSAEQIQIDGFINDFHDLLKKNEEINDRFANVEGVKYDAAEYIKYRFDALKKGFIHKKRLNKLKRLSQISQKKTKG